MVERVKRKRGEDECLNCRGARRGFHCLGVGMTGVLNPSSYSDKTLMA
jgi:hypothetical protein